MPSKKTTYGKAEVQTKYIAKFLNGKETIRSGATLAGGKGDLVIPEALLECKTYMQLKDSFTVKREWLTKIQKERLEDRKQFAFLAINFGGEGHKDNHIVMRIEDFKEIFNGYLDSIGGNDEV